MSDPLINVSSRGAFSFHWNQGVDSNNSYFIRAGKSFVGFIQAFFIGYAVSLSEAKRESLIQNGKHNNSIFVKECIRKFKAINIEIVNKPYSEKQKNNNEKQESKENDSNKEQHNYCQQEGFEAIGQPLTEKENEKRLGDVLTANALGKLMANEYFKSSDDRLSEDNLKLLNPSECVYLFRCALTTNSSESNEIAHRLLLTGNCGELVNISGALKMSALIFFLVNGNDAAVKYLLDKNIVNIDEKDGDGRTALYHFAGSDDVACVQKLLDYGANINEFSEDNTTPLHYAAIRGKVECMKLLLNNGARADAQRDSGMMPLHFAAMEGNEECLHVLLLHVNANVVNVCCGKDLMTPLHYAVKNGHTGCVTRLVDRGDLRINTTDISGETALHYASAAGNENCLKALLKHPYINLNVADNNGLTALSRTLLNGKLGCLDLLLKDKWIAINVLNSQGMMPLHYAILGPSEECFKRFLDATVTKSVGLEVYDATGNTPIHFAIKINAASRLKQLLAFQDIKSKVNDQNNDDYAALHLIAKNDEVGDGTGCLEELLSVGTINVNMVDKNGWTPLHWAAEKGNIKVIEVLLGVEGDIDVNKRNKRGETPLNLLKKSGNNYEECKKALQGWIDKEEV